MLQPVSIADLKYFSEIASAGSLSRAARHLGVSQPTLSVAIKRLESVVGQPLMTRGTKGIALTSWGHHLLSGSQALIEQWDRLISDTHQNAGKVAGRVDLGVHPSLARFTLPHFLPQILRDNPPLEVVLDFNLSRRVETRLVAGELDMAFVVNPKPSAQIQQKLLMTDRVGFFTARRNLKEDHSQDTLFYDSQVYQEQAVLDQARKNGIGFNRVVSVPNLDVIGELLAAEKTVGILPARVAALATTDLQWCHDSWPYYDDQICALVSAPNLLKPAIAYVWDSLHCLSDV